MKRLIVAVLGTLVAAALALQSGCGAPQDGAGTGTAGPPQQRYNWKLVTTWPKNLPALGVAPENFAKLVDRMSAGRLKIRVFGAGELVPAFEVFDTVASGSAEMGHGAAYYWRGKVPIAVMFATVPFGMTAQEMNAWLHYGGGLELWREVYAQHGLVPFAAGNSGVQMAGWFNREINSVDDLAGLKMRIPGLAGEVLSRAGGTPVAMPANEIFTSLQTGAIDATEWVGPYNDLALGLYQTARYYYYPGWHEPGPTLELIVNRDAFEALPADLQAIIEGAARAINADMLDEFTARNNAALVQLVDEHGVQLRRLPDDVLQRLHELSDQVVAELPGNDPLAQRVHASYTAFLKQVRAYHEISEQAYINAR